MILAQLHAAHDSLPPWSAYAVITGALCGFLLGAITMGAFALRLHRLHRFEERRAGSGAASAPTEDVIFIAAVGANGEIPGTRRRVVQGYRSSARGA